MGRVSGIKHLIKSSWDESEPVPNSEYVLMSELHLITCDCILTRAHTHTQVVWYVVHESLHRMLLPMLKWEQEGTASSENCVQFQTHYYTGRQCTALEIMLEILKVREPPVNPIRSAILHLNSIYFIHGSYSLYTYTCTPTLTRTHTYIHTHAHAHTHTCTHTH